MSDTQPLLAAFRRQRVQLAKLLEEAGVRVQDAEALLCDALTGMSPEGSSERVELEMLLRIDRACAEYAAARGRGYLGLGPQRVRDLPGLSRPPNTKRKPASKRRR